MRSWNFEKTEATAGAASKTKPEPKTEAPNKEEAHAGAAETKDVSDDHT